MTEHRPMLLIILDGWGYNPQPDSNAIAAAKKPTFDKLWKEAGIRGLNGHRSVGGYRASMYNALSLESVGVLVDVMSDLERRA